MAFIRVLSVAISKILAILVVIAFTTHSMYAVWCFGRHAYRAGELEGHGCFIFDCVEDLTKEGARHAPASTFSDRLVYALAATLNCIICLYFIRGYCEDHNRYNSTFLRGSAVTLPVEVVLCVRAAWTSSTYELTFVQLGLFLHLPMILMSIINLNFATDNECKLTPDCEEKEVNLQAKFRAYIRSNYLAIAAMSDELPEVNERANRMLAMSFLDEKQDQKPVQCC